MGRAKERLITDLGITLCRLQGVANGQPTEDQRNHVNLIIDTLSTDMVKLAEMVPDPC